MEGAVIIDVHHHLLAGEGYVDGLLRSMDAAGVDVVCLNGLGLPSDNWVGDLAPDNSDVAKAVADHPDRLAGLVVIRLGDHGSDAVRRLRDLGFAGVKTTRPRFDYDHPAFAEVYATAEELGLPILFQTGFIVSVPADRFDDVSSARCRPVLLDRVARTFPDLVVIMAHLGMLWHEEAAQLCRYHPNVYADLSGSLEGWRNRKAPSFFRELFYWPDAFRKILFGSDVHHSQLGRALDDHRRILALCGIPDDVVEDILGGTAYRLLGLDQGRRDMAPRLTVVPDTAAGHAAFARALADEIASGGAESGLTRLILPVGPTAQYPLLARICNEERISWRQVRFTTMDEYLDWTGRPVPEDHPLSFAGFMRQFLESLDESRRPPKDAFVAPDPFDIDRVARFIDEIGGIDTCYGGIGVHGHVAFNEPPLSRFTTAGKPGF
jgi:predicted TIM-barrel fold metal-dependent hydrolase